MTPAEFQTIPSTAMRYIPLAAGAVLCLASCSTVSPRSRMAEAKVSPPHSWASSPEATAGVDDEWLKRFSDPRLESLVAEALEKNLDLKLAATRLEKARGQAELAGVPAMPTLDLSGSPTRTKRNFIGFPMFGSSGTSSSPQPATITNNQFNLSLNLNWELDVWGRIAAGRSAAKASYEAAQQDYRAARTSLAAQVARSWFQLTEAKAQLTLAQEAQQTYQQTADAVRDRFQAGADQAGAAAQLRLSEADVASAKATVTERQQTLHSAARQLELLLGRYPEGSLSPATHLPTVPRSAPPGLPSQLLQRRPDIIAAERRHAAQGAKITEAWKALYPRIALTSSAGQNSQELSDLLKSEFGIWQLAGNLVTPVFAGGRIVGEIKVYYSDEKETLTQLENTLLKAFGEVETALSTQHDLTARQAAIQQAVALATDADKAAQADYRQGIGDILTVLAAQSRLVNWRSQALTIHRAQLENRIQLHLALGGDFKVKGKHPELPTPAPRSAVKTWWQRQIKAHQ